jgi:hypothetical protein
MVVRHDLDLENLGSMAVLPDDLSPLKIGSRGSHKGSHFVIIGRLKVAWSEGSWNEWYLLFDDGRQGWLAEAMGFYMLSFEVADTSRAPAAATLKVGKKYEIAPAEAFFVDDIKEASCVGSEGELPLPGLSKRKATSVDLSVGSGRYACIEYSSSEGVRLFIGQYVKFKDLRFSNIRDLAAETKRVREAAAFTCPSCNGPVQPLAPGHAAVVVCGYCGSTIDDVNRNLRVLFKAQKKQTIKPSLPIGAKGELFSTRWEVIGFMRRSDATEAFFWDEYLLFHPTEGFRWLTTENGHWVFLEMVRDRPRLPDREAAEVQCRDLAFRRYLAGKAKVQYVVGEFYWRVKTGDVVSVEDYIAPPQILCCERDKTESVWSLGTYVTAADISLAFNITDLPSPKGVAPCQPSPVSGKVKPAFQTFGLLILAITLLQLYFIITAADKTVYEEKIRLQPHEPTRTFTSQSFELPTGPANLEVALRAPVQNDWIDVNFDLINDSGAASMEFEQGVEYYTGWDSDGSWSEGSQQTDLLLSSVPAGRYHFVIQPAATGSPLVQEFTVTAKRDVTVYSNYFAALFLLLPYPLYLWFRNRAFETSRWADSDFSPYRTTESESEGD